LTDSSREHEDEKGEGNKMEWNMKRNKEQRNKGAGSRGGDGGSSSDGSGGVGAFSVAGAQRRPCRLCAQPLQPVTGSCSIDRQQPNTRRRGRNGEQDRETEKEEEECLETSAPSEINETPVVGPTSSITVTAGLS